MQKENGEFGIAFAIAAILMILTMFINLSAALVGRYFQKKENCMSNVMTVKDLCLWYGSAQALKDINIEIEERSITALIGSLRVWKIYFS